MGIFRKANERDDRETVILTCECVGGDMELNHAVTFTLHNLRFESGLEMPEAFVATHLRTCPDTFWRRLKQGIQYILGHHQLYGQYMETLIAPEDAQALRDFFDRYIQAHAEWVGQNKKTKEKP